MASPQNGFLTVNEAAEFLRVSISTIRRWIRDGSLPAHRAGKRRILLKRTDLARIVHTVVTDLGAPTTEPGRAGHAAGQATGQSTPPTESEEFDLGPLKGLIEFSPDRPVARRLTPEEQAKALAALRLAEERSKQLLAQNNGKPFPDSVPIIHEMREERTRQLMGEDAAPDAGTAAEPPDESTV